MKYRDSAQKLVILAVVHAVLHAEFCQAFVLHQLPATPLTTQNIRPRQKLLPVVASKRQGVALRSVTSYYQARSVFLRGLGYVHFVAFLVALRQNSALIGNDGLTPAKRVLEKAEDHYKKKDAVRREYISDIQENISGGSKMLQRIKKVLHYSKLKIMWDRQDGMGRPLVTLLYLCKDRSNLNTWLSGVALTGIIFSLFILIAGSANVPILFTLWLCQRSLMSVGGCWYGYGWEPQLAELTFHAMFLVPFLSLNSLAMAPPNLTVYLVRLYLFRIMIGAGLIKLRSNDPKWRFTHLSTMEYFYETQPVPNPFSRWLHGRPKWWHKCEVLANHFVELVAPWGLILPVGRVLLIATGLTQIIFQGILIGSGNLR